MCFCHSKPKNVPALSPPCPCARWPSLVRAPRPRAPAPRAAAPRWPSRAPWPSGNPGHPAHPAVDGGGGGPVCRGGGGTPVCKGEGGGGLPGWLCDLSAADGDHLQGDEQLPARDGVPGRQPQDPLCPPPSRLVFFHKTLQNILPHALAPSVLSVTPSWIPCIMNLCRDSSSALDCL